MGLACFQIRSDDPPTGADRSFSKGRRGRRRRSGLLIDLQKVLSRQLGEESSIKVDPEEIEVVRLVHGSEGVAGVVGRCHRIHEGRQRATEHVEERIADRIFFRPAQRRVFKDVGDTCGWHDSARRGNDSRETGGWEEEEGRGQQGRAKRAGRGGESEEDGVACVPVSSVGVVRNATLKTLFGSSAPTCSHRAPVLVCTISTAATLYSGISSTEITSNAPSASFCRGFMAATAATGGAMGAASASTLTARRGTETRELEEPAGENPKPAATSWRK